MQPLSKHPILSHLPYKLLMNPSIAEIKSFLVKRSRTMKRLKLFSIVLFIFQALNILFFSEPLKGEFRLPFGLDTIINYMLLIGFPFMVYSFNKLEKQCAMSDEEINNAIDG